MDNRIKEQIKKIMRLAEQGIGGEKSNALTLLNRLLKKYSLSLEDFKDNVKIRYKFYCRTKHEEQLLINTVGKVLNIDAVPLSDIKRAVYINLTRLEFAKIDYLYEIYRKELRKELKKQAEITFQAFLSTNNIYPDCDSNRKKPEIDPEELQRILSARKGMSRILVNNLIEQH